MFNQIFYYGYKGHYLFDPPGPRHCFCCGHDEDKACS